MIAVPRKRRSIQLAKKFYQSLPDIACPVNIRQVYKVMGWDLRLADGLKGKTEGVTFHYQGCFCTFLPLSSKLKTSGRLRFTLGHEIGHIVLGHFQDFDLNFLSCKAVGSNVIEILNQEANFFCSEFLMPEDMIKKNITEGKAHLKSLFGVSEQALSYRLDNLGCSYLFDKKGNYAGSQISETQEEYVAVCLDDV